MDQARLAHKFREQQAFAAGYSPLYERLFGVVAGWLDAPGAANDPLVQWLLHAGRQRHTLDVTLLLAAGLHRAVLAGKSSAAGLAAYYSTAGHYQSPDDPGFAATLRQAILANREELAAFIGAARVQTNETGRGLCWLLPLLATGWPAAFHRAQHSNAPVCLFPANLPGELPDFLRQIPAEPPHPVVIYNTYMTTYLDDKGLALGKHIGDWAATQPRPVLWLQWEPPRDGRQPPEMGWCTWTADRWQGRERRHWSLGWVHPHGQAAELETELGSFGDG
ncbi:MAG: DUF2332 domain-containing protein [Chloroflexi bacterium]|nr:DUF2332 domain-containing protein [Chloroflexota bacterium]MCI0575847.1 DUF2332 domain-containing protein [Chloroflexota bacterium]MCI0646574.1 DUF2332 domain-containing protein [Chloroflexota bacterium]MCI0726376.1 DUF2332 domain-containing protein [Chloroflexota bacterium]